jgi:hypothetical protein
MGNSLVLNRRPKVPAEDSAAFGAIAERFRRAGALEQAVSLCRDGLKKFPEHVSARVTLGWSLLDLGRYDEARIELEQVLRRAPDNLAAIRGLAELHDRFEHTLNLSMDGPGQWPPPPEAVDGDVEVSVETSSLAVAEEDLPLQPATAFAEAAADVEFVPDTAPAMAPADMGLPLWSPEAVAEPAPVAAVDHQPQSGMSSVREIDAFAGVPVVASAEAPAVERLPTELHAGPLAAAPTDDDVLSDPTLAELIAESASLDSVAELESAELGATLDLEAADPEPLGRLEADLAADLGVVEELESILGPGNGTIEVQASDEEAPVDLAAMQEFAGEQLTASASVELPVEFAAPSEPEFVEAPVAEAVAETFDERVAHAAAEIVEPAVVAETIVETVGSGAADAVAEAAAVGLVEAVAEPEPQLVEAAAVPAEAPVAETIADVVEAAVADVVAELAEAPAAEELSEVVAAPVEVPVEAPVPVAAVVELVDHRAARTAATVAALEHMLARVEARRQQLMTQSVA